MNIVTGSSGFIGSHLVEALLGNRSNRGSNKRMASMSKIIPLNQLVRWKKRPVVMAHGCFDVLHYGHIKHLQSAKKNGATLIVTVTADRYVNKGEGRPIFTAQQRAEMLSALECVDYVSINNSEDACEALRLIKPDIYVKGIDYKNIECKEFKIARLNGAKVIFTDTEKYSSTKIIEEIK